MSPPQVSVVMATYRGDRLDHLRVSIDSILAQSFTDFEYIIVVDGPISDETSEYLNAIADTRVRLIQLDENAGPAKARNVGIETALGEFLVIQDADDLSDPTRIQKQLDFLSASGLDIVGSCVNEIDAAGTFVKHKPYPTDGAKIASLMPFVNTINNSAVFCRSHVLKTLPYPENLRFGEDYRTWIAALKNGMKLGNHPEYLVSYRLASARRRGWQTAKTDVRIKLSALAITKWYKWPVVTVAAFATGALRMIPGWAIIYVYRLKERILPKLAKYQSS